MSNFDDRRWNWRRPQPTELGATDLTNRFAEQLPLTSPPDEQPGPDGIRWGLVNRVRAEIAAGIYDDDEKWAMAQELLFQRVCADD
ncbi:hypothetical protein [Limnoglobus roseus]|uniref:Anti-sigma-28 factor FlgM C-terminal domain-containing protein n=1 Tax=Limnoglobus roseus TaxID=2598579 RepID=A0A5C1A809_9BACT|nr:hypothetical protein [Limnoglobus roseus]QEL13264.1 hypothetical protein PX52LOC_00118 [Limnoglobus roseus]